jgi:two-component system response regulator AtoC
MVQLTKSEILKSIQTRIGFRPKTWGMKTLISGHAVEVVIRFHCPDISLDPDALIARIGKTQLPVLITGETGTGKELLARAIHLQTVMRPGPFVAIDCGALPPTLIEAELFGYRKGAFTGALISKVGLLTCADGGTIFLDEIGELPLELQPKLLRVLQEHEVRPIGASQAVPIRSRIIAATNRDLEEMVREGKFREDLYYRIAGITLNLPPLRAHPDDIPASCEVILGEMLRETHSRHTISEEAMMLMREYDWPGNIRELENCLKRATALNPEIEVIGRDDLPPKIRIATACNQMSCRKKTGTLHEIERQTVLKAMDEAHGNKQRAAELLGIGKTTLYRKLKEYAAEAFVTNGS